MIRQRVIERPNPASVEDCRRVAARNADDPAAIMARVEAAIFESVDAGRFGIVHVDVQNHGAIAIDVARDTLVASGWDVRLVRDHFTRRAVSLIVAPP